MHCSIVSIAFLHKTFTESLVLGSLFGGQLAVFLHQSQLIVLRPSKVGAEITLNLLIYPLKLVAKNAGVGSLVRRFRLPKIKSIY
jgi:hypothetical protein